MTRYVSMSERERDDLSREMRFANIWLRSKKMVETIHSKTDDFRQYERRVLSGELRPYVEGESLRNISVSDDDRDRYGCPKVGDMIARDPKDRDNQWLVSKEYFEQHYLPEPLVPYPDLTPDAPKHRDDRSGKDPEF